MLVIFRDSEREPDQELDNTLLDDHHACPGAAWLLQRFLGSDSVLAMKRALSGSNKDKPEEPHSLKEALGGADTQQASSTARMNIGARFRALALGRSSGTALVDQSFNICTTIACVWQLRQSCFCGWVHPFIALHSLVTLQQVPVLLSKCLCRCKKQRL